jgi:mitochondrial fission protein ELM1
MIALDVADPAARPPDAGLASLPRTWLLLGDKPGDNAQVDVLADALGWPYEKRRLRFSAAFVTGKPAFAASLHHVDLARSDALAPPWPELILTIGRRPSMAALWIKQQARGACKVVLIGRPRALWEQFDLVLAPPQYRVPDRPEVVRLALPLLRVNPTDIAAAAAAWRDRLARLARPLTAVLVGGPTGAFVFDSEVAASLIRRTRHSTGDDGALFVTTSRRTPEHVIPALAATLPPGSELYRWRADASDNPYKALLGLADRFVVTGDSASMLVEVARAGKPLAIFPLPERIGRVQWLRRRLADVLQPPTDGPGRSPLAAALGRWLFARGIVLYSREFEALYRALAARGLATMLGQPFPSPATATPDDLPAVAARVRQLFAATP